MEGQGHNDKVVHLRRVGKRASKTNFASILGFLFLYSVSCEVEGSQHCNQGSL